MTFVRTHGRRLSWALALALGVAALGAPGSAQAQAIPGVATPPASPTAADLDKAKEHMAAGAAFYNDPSGRKSEEAYREFKRAYELSGSNKALRSLGSTARELERDGEAIAVFEKYLALTKGEKDEQVERDLRTLKASVAWVTLKSPVAGARIVDVRTPSRGFPVKNTYVMTGTEQRLGLHPGEHAITASVEGQAELVWKVDLANARATEHTFEFKSTTSAPATDTPAPAAAPEAAAPTPTPTTPTTVDQPTNDRPIPTTVYIFGGLTVALAVPTVIFMVGAGSAKSDFDAANGNAGAAELEDKRSAVTSKNLLSDIFLVATLGSGAATAVLYATRPTKQPTTAARRVRFTPVVAPTRAGSAFVGALATGRF